MRVAVIGAGICGLAALKHGLEYDLGEVVCFEAEDAIGGLWYWSEEERHASVYDSTCINTPRDCNSYADCPHKPEDKPQLHHKEVLQYMNLYADKYNLRRHIRLNTRVTGLKPVQKDPDTGKYRWELKALDVKSGKETTTIFDNVMITSGHHTTKKWPEGIEGLDMHAAKENAHLAHNFDGEVIHSHMYRNNKPYVGKRVCVIGIGNSGSDITTETAKVSAKTTLVSRSGFWLLPNPNATCPRADPFTRLDGYITGMLSQDFQSKLIKTQVSQFQAPVKALGLEPNHKLLAAHPTVTLSSPTNNLFEQIAAGKIQGKRGVVKVGPGKKVTFVDGTEEDFDAVICCTGYQVGCPFVPEEVPWRNTQDGAPAGDNEVSLYRLIFTPDVAYQSLAWVGGVQPLGSMFMIGDVQSRYICSVWKGLVGLPDPEAMWQNIRERRAANLEWYVNSPRHTIQVHPMEYLDLLAKDMGVQPTVLGCLMEGGLSLLWWAFTTQNTAAHYRLTGPNKKTAEALVQIKTEWKDLHSEAPRTNGIVKRLIFGISYFIFFWVGLITQLIFLLTRGKIVFRPFF